MGNREKFVINFEGKIIEYQGRNYGVIKQFEYNGKDYLCCVEKTEQGNQCVCTDGPVFNIKKLLW